MTEDHIEEIINVHYSLWSYKSLVEWNNKFYSTKLSTKSLYNSVLLPNKNGKNMLWISQPNHLDSSFDDYGSLIVKEEFLRGNTCRITWIVDVYNGKFSYIGRVFTNYIPKEDSNIIVIERYKDNLTETIYTNQPDSLKEIYE